MKPVFKPSIFALICVTVALALSACSKSDTPETLILGDWKQAEAITIDQAGVSVSMTDGTVSYAKDGTSKGTMAMSIGGMPEEFANYNINTTGKWRIEDNMLVESLVDAKVTSASGSPQAAAIATQMKAGMLAQAEGKSEIRELTKASLIVHQPEVDMTMTFKR